MIIVQLLGGMANQMFQYALGRHLAIKNKTNLFLDTSFLNNRKALKKFTFREYAIAHFNIEAIIAEEKLIPLYSQTKSIKSIPFRIFHVIKSILYGFKYIREFKFKFQPNILKLQGNIYLDGNWQSEKYFLDIADVIKKDFLYKFEISEPAKTMISQIKSSNSVCIHVRRGDYLINTHHGTIDLAYIQKGTEIIASKVIYPHFFIFSNDLNWCEKNIKLRFPLTFINRQNSGNNDIEHFELMKSCKHFIIANSSFSWWAAWLADNESKIVVAPNKWLNNPKIDTSDVLPESWIKI